MSFSVSSPSAATFGYRLSMPSSSAAVQSVRSAEAAAIQSVSIATSDAVRSVKTAEDPLRYSYISSGGDQHQIRVPTDLTPLVKGG